MPETVKTLDNGLKVYMEPDLGSQIIAELTEGAEVQLGACTISDGREWLEATVGGALGYVLAPSARGHTTLRPPEPSLRESVPGLRPSAEPPAQPGARNVLGARLYAIGWLLLMAFGICTMFYWVGALSAETTETLKVCLGGPAMVLLVSGRLLSRKRKEG